jgi:tetratricopeptide (TPR) repeat protein
VACDGELHAEGAMSRLIKIADWSGEKRGNVVFVHGLGGHPYDTWRRRADDGTFWPLWLAQDIKGLAVYSLGYTSPPTNWIGTAMPLLDEAAHALRVLLNSEDLKTGPIAFICHSLGGLIVKQVLRAANEQRNDPDLADFLARTRRVVFIATPHTGSGKATLMERLRFIVWGSDSARDLVANKPELRDLNFGYRELAKTRGDELRHLAFYEMADTPFGRIVNPDSADPGLPDCRPTPIREDHIAIAKPRRRDDLVYAETKSFISKLAAEPAVVGELRNYPLEPFKIEWSWQRAVPKLVRVAAVGVVAFGLWQGLPLINSAINTIFKIDAQVGEVQERSKETLENIEKLSRQIADLQASRASEPVTPEAKARAAKSIQPAIEDLTRRTDERSKQAFEALQKGDTSAAESLFGAILEEKTREGQAANREAASAARNIAAFKRLTNVAKAAELYGRAAALDPEDFETWIDLGDMSIAIGKLAQGGTAFDRAFAIVERFARTDPGNAGWQRDLSVSYNKIGDVLVDQGHLPEALKSYRDGLAIRDGLAQSDPDNAGWQRDLSVSYNKIGDVLVAQGNLAEALKSFRDGLAIAERLARADPGNAGWQRDLSVSYNKIGDVLVAQGNLPEALKSFLDGLAIRERLAQADPGNAGWQRDLSVSYEKIGDVLVARGNLAEALKSYRNDLAVAERLAQADPGNAGWQRDLSVSYAKLASAFRRGGEKAKALDALRRGRAIMARMTTLSPDNAVWKRDLAWFEGQIAELAR